MSEEKIDMEVTAKGAKISVQGGPANRLGHALADALSPFTQSLGAIGDVIRIFREDNISSIIDKGREISQRNGSHIGNSSPKFLVDFVEKASLEESESLRDLWAGLLVSASIEERGHHYFLKKYYHHFQQIM
ncbi:MAG: hypothetical protein AAGC57_11710 [Pseudomonadota bacterium]